MTLPPAVLVFIGGCLGGGARMAIDALLGDWTVPWEIVAINVVGSFALGGVAAHTARHGVAAWTPLVSTGALGGFTTFSAIAAMGWTAEITPAQAVAVLALNLVSAVLAAAVGWRVVDRHAPAASLTESDL
ncbi:fluoride efflux transporter FluC [Demequina sp.]|uniref:fluoride efflux transporter FluC n=1 Tax=Demequina sp. TaxID=2050685 RepID=UPI003A8B4C29